MTGKMMWCCPVCGQPSCPNPQGPKVLMVPFTRHELVPGATAHWYRPPRKD